MVRSQWLAPAAIQQAVGADVSALRAPTPLIGALAFRINNNVDLDSPKHSRLIWLVFVAVVIVWGLNGLVLYRDADRGTYGDMFGVVNALFSGLAFAGIIYTIYLQKIELGLQRKELEDTRKELKRSAEAQEKSEIALSQQAQASAMSAQLSAINYLLSYYDAEGSRIGGAFTEGSPMHLRFEDLQKRRNKLLKILDETYEKVTADQTEG